MNHLTAISLRQRTTIFCVNGLSIGYFTPWPIPLIANTCTQGWEYALSLSKNERFARKTKE